MSDDFVFDWTKTLGFKKNPFHTDIPKPVDKYFSGCLDERKKLNLFILEKYDFGTITGGDGSGKTMILKWIESQLSKHRDRVRIAYINASDLNKERDLIVGLVEPLLNVYEKTIAKTQDKLRLEEVGKFIYSKLKGGQKLLILMDDAGGLPKRYVSLFRYFFKNKIGVQLILAGTKKEIHESGLTSIADKDRLKIKLSGLELKDAEGMVMKRINNYGQKGIFPFQESMLKRMHDKSDGNPKAFLEMCREKAIKLALDKDYISQEMEKYQDVPTDSVISIKLGAKKEEKEEKGEELFDMDVPDMKEQEEMLAELVKEEKPPVKEAPVEPEKTEKKKSDKKVAKEAKETEDLLSQLAQEFEKE